MFLQDLIFALTNLRNEWSGRQRQLKMAYPLFLLCYHWQFRSCLNALIQGSDWCVDFQNQEVL